MRKSFWSSGFGSILRLFSLCSAFSIGWVHFCIHVSTKRNWFVTSHRWSVSIFIISLRILSKNSSNKCLIAPIRIIIIRITIVVIRSFIHIMGPVEVIMVLCIPGIRIMHFSPRSLVEQWKATSIRLACLVFVNNWVSRSQLRQKWTRTTRDHQAIKLHRRLPHLNRFRCVTMDHFRFRRTTIGCWTTSSGITWVEMEF